MTGAERPTPAGRPDPAFWEEVYRDRDATRSGPGNPYLGTAIENLAPGTALDAGCGAGADAIWLAARGWHVTAVDVAPTALRHARAHAERAGVADRITWIEADMTTWSPAVAGFDLVYSHYVHVATSHQDLWRRLASAVAPHGTLLVVGHDRSDPHVAEFAPDAHVHLAADDVLAGLDTDRWDAVVERHIRQGSAGDGHGQGQSHGEGHGEGHGREVTLHDVVVCARSHA